MKHVILLLAFALLAASETRAQLALTFDAGILRTAERFREPNNRSIFSDGPSKYMEPSFTWEVATCISGKGSRFLRWHAGFRYQHIYLHTSTIATYYWPAAEWTLRGHQIGFLGGLSIENWARKTFACFSGTFSFGYRIDMQESRREILSNFPTLIRGPLQSYDTGDDLFAGLEVTFGVGTHIRSKIGKCELVGRLQDTLLANTQWVLGLRLTAAIPFLGAPQPHTP